jgi:hypothetical protein
MEKKKQKNQKKNRVINHQTDKQWQLYQRLGRFIHETERQPEAAEIIRIQPRSAPAAMVEMIF